MIAEAIGWLTRECLTSIAEQEGIAKRCGWRTKWYQSMTIDDECIAASRANPEAFVPEVWGRSTTEM